MSVLLLFETFAKRLHSSIFVYTTLLRMKKQYLLIFMIILFSRPGFASHLFHNDPDSIHKYLISFNFSKHAILYKENKLIVAKDMNGKRARGRLHIISDTIFLVKHDLSSKIDTFNINELRKIKRMSYVTDVLGYAFMIGAVPLIYIGVDLIIYSYGIFDYFLGVFVTANGIGYLTTGALAKSGFTKKTSQKNVFALATTKGFKLNSKNAKAYALERYPHLKNKRIRRY